MTSVTVLNAPAVKRCESARSVGRSRLNKTRDVRLRKGNGSGNAPENRDEKGLLHMTRVGQSMGWISGVRSGRKCSMAHERMEKKSQD